MQTLWLKIQPSVFSITFENAEGRISSGTGFKIGSFLVTNNHVIQTSNAKRIVIRSVLQDGYSPAIELKFGHLMFRQMLIEGDAVNSWDYAILKIENPSFLAAPSLQLEDHDEVSIGSNVALFGYQFDQPQLSMHQGNISSQYYKAGVHYIQLDSSVNHGNSGGPLIDTNTGRVIGLVTRKATGLTVQFDELLQSLKKNINMLQAMQSGGVFISGLDPVAATLAIQTQMEHLAREISRSANVGIGYAYHIRKVRSSLKNLV